MRSRAVRLTLTLLAIASIPAAAYVIWTIEQQEQARQHTAAAFERHRTEALRNAFELRAAQQAYVAAGQGEAYWFDKVSALRDAIRGGLEQLQSSGGPETQPTLEETAGALRQFEAADRRARNYAATGQKLLASDIIFSDGLNAITTVISTLEGAGAQAHSTSALAASAADRKQLILLSASAGAMLLALLLLAPLPAAGEQASEASAEPETPAGSLDLKPRVNAVAPRTAATATGEVKTGAPERKAGVTASATAPSAATSLPPAPPNTMTVDVQALAALCTDLARLADTEKLPSILDRTAQALDASGLILWIADPDGSELVPVAAHGYAAAVLARLGTIRTDAENATAAAFRTGLLQTVGARAGSSGAIAAPLVTSSGCRGVMSAEVRHDGEKQRAKLAAASIVAAQLATMIGPLPAAAADGREAAM